jgi:hypothetical protein
VREVAGWGALLEVVRFGSVRRYAKGLPAEALQWEASVPDGVCRGSNAGEVGGTSRGAQVLDPGSMNGQGARLQDGQ